MALLIAIPTRGRRAIIGPVLRDITRQTRMPDRVIVVISAPEDLDFADLRDLPFRLQVVTAPAGLTRQRNAALDVAAPEDVLLFLDDDFVMAADYLANLNQVLMTTPDLVMVTGHVLADGITGPGLVLDHALALLAALPPVAPGQALRPVYNGYGCNMAIRMAPVVAHALRFDPRLPFYGWLEDVDFSRQLAPHGAIGRSAALRGVHLGTRSGRSSGLRLGYSQVANPLYLRRKHTMRSDRALSLMARNILANLAKYVAPEPGIDRAGRLRGNLRALGDLLRGRLNPERITEFD